MADMFTPETWLEYMIRRGWTTKVIQRYGVGGSRYDERPCLKYHTMNPGGGKAHRAKFVDGNKDASGKPLSKVKWAGSLGEGGQSNFTYYSPGGLSSAITQASGTLYWLSGEPDCWTLYEACGIDFSTCCFGEGSVPETVASDLLALGVEIVVMYPDLDNAGMKAAWKLHKALKDTDIKLVVRRIPGEMGSKRDLNQLWQDMSFNTAAFTEALKKSVVLTETDLELYAAEEKPAISQPKQASLDIDFGDMYLDWINEVIKSLGQCDVKEGRVERWHCPTGRHADKTPSFRVAYGDKIPMPMCTCGVQDLDPTPAWNEVARGKGMPTWDDYKARKLADLGHLKTAKANPPQVPHTNGTTPKAETVADTEPLWVDSHTVYSQILDTLEGYNIPDIEIVDFPLECLHEFGGFAEIMFPGKLVYLSGISGGGKTSIAETMGEKLLRQGYDFVWYGPEWTPYEMGLRSLQRAQGADMMTMAKNYQYQVQAKRGVDESKRKGRLLSDAELVNSNREILNMANWPGRSYFMTAQANKLPLADMLNTVRYIVNLKRSEGRKVIGFFFDYLQRANKAGRQHAFWSEEVIGEIKALCEELQLIGFVMIQPKKGDSEKARDDTTLSEASGQGISDQQCNLYLAVTPKFENDVKTTYSILRVVKNSMGKTGEITVQNDWQRLLLIDKRIRIAGVL